MEQNERRFQRERDDLLRTLGGIESGLASLTLRMDDPSQYLPPLNLGRRTKRPEGMELESPIGGTSNMIALPSPYSGPSGLPGMGRHRGSSTASGSVTPKHPGHISLGGVLPYSSIPETSFDPVHCLTQPVPNSAYPPGSSITKSSHKPVHLRSSLLPILKNTTTHAKVAGVMTELGVHPSRVVMPTTTNIEKFEAFQQATISLVEMKKTVDKVEQEIKVLTARLRGGSEAADTDGGAPGDGDREQSAASVDPSEVRVRAFSCNLPNVLKFMSFAETFGVADVERIIPSCRRAPRQTAKADVIKHRNDIWPLSLFFVIKPLLFFVPRIHVPLIIPVNLVVFHPLCGEGAKSAIRG